MAKKATKKSSAKKAPAKKTALKKIKGGMAIKTFEDACRYGKIDPKKLPDVSMIPKRLQSFMINMYKAVVIAEAINEGWMPDWNNSGQYKYYPWFWMKKDSSTPSGFAFSFTSFGSSHSLADVGSRLCFKSSELARYAGEQFKDVYQAIMLIEK